MVIVLLSCQRLAPADEYRLASFTVDITIPLGHRCMGVLPVKAQRVIDPLYAHGFVLLGVGQPIVLVALDYCEVRNGAYDQWRDALAQAAGTSRQRVLVCSLHQHDAPVTDTGAEELLAGVGLGGELCDIAFHRQTIQRVARALNDSIARSVPITHLGIGQAKVHRVASTRRVELPDGGVNFSRGSSSGRDPFHRDADEGAIDPWLKTISFWNGEQPVLALSAYAVHPMSYYGRGEVSADFVGMARQRRQQDNTAIRQVYVSGCSGDVTAGKYNDGSPENRPLLANRMYDAMVAAWEKTNRIKLQNVAFRNTTLDLEFHDGHEFTAEALTKTLHNADANVKDRILAAMGLSSRQRIAGGQPIDVPCIDLGAAQIVLLPGEAFVGYQHIAQRLRPDSFVMTIGYGECWPGYIPLKRDFDENFGHSWRWVAPGAEERITAALQRVLVLPPTSTANWYDKFTRRCSPAFQKARHSAVIERCCGMLGNATCCHGARSRSRCKLLHFGLQHLRHEDAENRRCLPRNQRDWIRCR